MTIDELREKLLSGEIAVDSPPNVIETGELQKTSGEIIEYSIQHGWDILLSLECDKAWGKFNLELFEYIDSQNFDDDKLAEVLDSIPTEDHHWDWFKKSIGYKSSQYEWFYLCVDGKPQGACLIYHPEDSALAEDKIFYVEFIATAPWNRTSLVHTKEIKGVGPQLLKCALNYSVNKLGLSPGFSLHSLPQATTYYTGLKMVNVASKDKPSLLYFELPKNEALAFLEAV